MSSSSTSSSIEECSLLYYKTRVNLNESLKREAFARLQELSSMGNIFAELFVICVFCRGSTNFIEIDLVKASELSRGVDRIRSILEVYIDDDKEEETKRIEAAKRSSSDMESMYVAYIRGVYFDDVVKNSEQGFKWFRRSACMGYTFGQCSYGYCMDEGRGCLVNKREAARWYYASAAGGHSFAQYNLGHCYQLGVEGCIVKDSKRAFMFYELAALQGDSMAQFTLGAHYEEGWGCEPSDDMAFKWYLLSSEQGDVDACVNVGVFYDSGKCVAKNPAKAVEYYQKAVDKIQDADAMYYLAEHHFDGNGAPKDIEKAITLWRIVASKNNKLGTMRLSSFMRGLGIGLIPPHHPHPHMTLDSLIRQAMSISLINILPVSVTKNTCIPEYLYGDKESHRSLTMYPKVDHVVSFQLASCLFLQDCDISLVNICKDIMSYLREDDVVDDLDVLIQNLMDQGGVLYEEWQEGDDDDDDDDGGGGDFEINN